MLRICSLVILILISSHALAVGNPLKPVSFDQSFLSATFIKYNQDEDYIEATGNVVMTADGNLVTADNMFYDIKSDKLWANGNVRINDGTEKVTIGEHVFFEDKFKKGVIKQFILYLGDNSIIAARLAERVDKDHGVLEYASYTPCSLCKGKKPMWQISAQRTELDLAKERVTYKKARFEVYGKPVLFIPYFSHPTPNAKAQSGILLPQTQNQRLGIPMYYRAKPNFDMTFTPRFVIPKPVGKKKKTGTKTIYELEARYLTKNGQYNLQTSFMNSTTKKGGHYYVFANGSFVDRDYHYSIGLNRASDKAYLKNYYQMRQPYLASNLSVYKTDGEDFISADSLYFQGLGADDKTSTNPLILPEIHARRVVDIGDQDTYFTFENTTLGYKEAAGKGLSRTSMDFKLTHLHDTEGGHRLKFEGYNRTDLYYINSTPKAYNKKHGFLKRNIPEFHAGWKYPLIKNYNGGSIFLEPQALFVLGSGNADWNHKYAKIDMGNYTLSEENLFRANRFSGIDYHEYGTRLSYGLASTFTTQKKYTIQTFIGRLNYLTKNSASHNADIVGRMELSYDDTYSIYYRFKHYAKGFKLYQNDIGMRYHDEKIDTSLGFVNIAETKYFEYSTEKSLTSPKIKQVYVNLNYNLDDNWSIGTDARFDFLSRGKAALVYRNIKVTYSGDCVSIVTRFGHDYTSDPARGIIKTRTNSISVGLKTLM